MRLWSLHPKYLDSKGLVALWREGLLAQAVLAGQTRGYKQHPQLERFIQSAAPSSSIAAYLQEVCAEALRRGYHFDGKKVNAAGKVESILVTLGQLEYEWAHLTRKLRTRAPAWLNQLGAVKRPEPHPLFSLTPGAVAPWEVIAVEPTSSLDLSPTRPRG